jgi:HAD superfamily phosphatase (TIGR01668 family)
MLVRHTDPIAHGKRYTFRPDFIVDSVADIDFGYLKKRGIRAALIDLDGTVVARGTYDVSSKISQHLKRQDIRVYIATNRPKSRSLKNLKEALNANGVLHPKGIIGKPFAHYYAQAVKEHNLKPEECVMIGDRLLQDIFGANAAGLTTIAVRKLDKPTNVIDTLLSRTERNYLDKIAPAYDKHVS